MAAKDSLSENIIKTQHLSTAIGEKERTSVIPQTEILIGSPQSLWGESYHQGFIHSLLALEVLKTTHPSSFLSSVPFLCISLPLYISANTLPGWPQEAYKENGEGGDWASGGLV